MAKKNKCDVLDVSLLDLHGIKSNHFTLMQTHLSHSYIQGVPPPPRQLKSNMDCFLPLGALAQRKINVTRWAFDTGASWDQIQSLFPQVATSLQYRRTGFPLLACCHNTYIELIPWHRTAICQHQTFCCHLGGDLFRSNV